MARVTLSRWKRGRIQRAKIRDAYESHRHTIHELARLYKKQTGAIEGIVVNDHLRHCRSKETKERYKDDLSQDEYYMSLDESGPLELDEKDWASFKVTRMTNIEVNEAGVLSPCLFILEKF